MKQITADRNAVIDRLKNVFASKGKKALSESEARDAARVMVALKGIAQPFTEAEGLACVKASLGKKEDQFYRISDPIRDLQAAKMLRRGPDGRYTIV